MSHVCEAVDRDKHIEPLQQKIHILSVQWDWIAKVGHTRQMDNDDVEAWLESLQANPPSQPVRATIRMGEGTNMPSVVSRRTRLCTSATGGVYDCNFVGGMSFGSFFLQNADLMMCRQ